MGLEGTGSGGSLARAGEAFRVLRKTGFLSPSFLRTIGPSLRKFGTTTAGGFHAAANRHPDAIAIIDEEGEVTFGELERATNALARGLAAAGVKPGDGVGLFARNHRGFAICQTALDKLGANTLLLNTGFAAPQFEEVAAREGIGVVMYDEEFASICAGGGSLHRLVTDTTGPGSIAELIEANDDSAVEPPPGPGRITVLTSGTTGTPKGAQRTPRSQGVDALVGMFGRIPLRTRTRTLIAAPAFHSWGGLHLLLAAQLGSTVCFRRRFDPEDTLATIDRLRPEVLAVVPVMMQRILELPPETIAKYDTSSLEIVAASGSVLPGDLAIAWMDTFGDNIYNLYGSTEVGPGSIATPDELRINAATAGRPPRGVTLRVVDDEGNDVPVGVTGRIFVGNSAQFDGYTGGGDKEKLGDLRSSGDVGHFDEHGLLYIDGRDDDMIVSGGENVFPREVEDLLAQHEAVAEASVIGAPDEQFGQRLVAFVALNEGASCDASTLQAYVKSNLARYKVPRDVHFVDALPRNPTGKVLKRVLAERL